MCDQQMSHHHSIHLSPLSIYLDHHQPIKCLQYALVMAMSQKKGLWHGPLRQWHRPWSSVKVSVYITKNNTFIYIITNKLLDFSMATRLVSFLECCQAFNGQVHSKVNTPRHTDRRPCQSHTNSPYTTATPCRCPLRIQTCRSSSGSL